MKIALINQKTGYIEKVDRDAYFNKVRSAVNSGADYIIGPELALGNRNDLISPDEAQMYAEKMFGLLKSHQLLIPGTVLSKGNYLVNSAPVITSNNIEWVRKKTSVTEDEIAKNKGVEYLKGTSREGVINHNGKKIGIEICRDHGHAKLRNSGVSDLELHAILATNLASGVNAAKIVVRPGGIVAINDGAISGYGRSVYKYEGGQLVDIQGKASKNYDFFEI